MVASAVYKGNRRQLLLVLSDLTSHSQFRGEVYRFQTLHQLTAKF